MPKVMMLGRAQDRLPMAGQYRPPIGRVLNPTSVGTRGLSGSDIRGGLMAPLLARAGVGMLTIPSRTLPETIPGAMRLPQLGAPRYRPGTVVTPTDIARRDRRIPRIPRYVRNERIPGAVRLPNIGFPPSALNGAVGFPPSALMGFIPGQSSLPMLRSGRGLGGLGDVDMCNDTGWIFANNALATAGAIMQGAAGEDSGWQAAGGVTAGAASAWRTACQREAQLRQQAANAQGDPTQADELRRMLELEQIRRQAEGEAYQRYQAVQQNLQQNQQASSGEVPDWVLPAVGIGAAGVLALLILRK